MDLGSQTVIYPMKGMRLYQLLLVASKVAKAFACFVTFEILKSMHTVTFLLVLKLSAVLILLPLQKPFSSGQAIKPSEWFQISRFSIARLALDALWVEGLYLCGPFRFILLFEHSELVALAVASTIIYGSTSPSKTRGSIFFIIGILGVALFDHDISHEHNAHPEGIHKSLLIHKVYELFANFGLSDHKVGVLILIVAVFLDAGFAAMSRSLVTSIGGAKRLQALSSLVSLVFLLPIYFLNAIFSIFSDSRQLSQTESTSTLWLFISLLFVGGITVLDFYLTSIASSHLGSYSVTQLAKFTITLSGLVICILQSHGLFLPSAVPISVPSHQLSSGVLFALVAILYGSNLLTNSKLGYGPDGSSSGHFIGYSMTGLPLFTAAQTPTHGVGMLNQAKSMGLSYHIRTTLKGIMSEQSSRRIFAFLCLNLVFTFVELLYGVWTNSLGLISDGFHMLFDSAALVVGLYAAVVAHWKPTRLFSYGFHSAEVLSGFVNALFLLVISGSVFVNALARIHRPPEIHTDRLMAVSVAGLLVNLVGIFALGHAHSHGGGGHGHSHSAGHGHSHTSGHGHSHAGDHGHSHSSGHGHDHGSSCGHGHSHITSADHNHASENELHYGHAHGHKKHKGDHVSHSPAGGDANLRGVYLHVLADTLGSVGVIFSSYLVSTYGWNIADPICSVFIACAIGYSAMPLLYDTLALLTLRAPCMDHSTYPELIVNKVLDLESVQSIYNPFVWSQTRDTICVSLCVRIDSEVSEQLTLAHITELVTSHCPNVTHLTVQVEKEVVHYHFQAMGIKPNVLLQFPKSALRAHCDDHAHQHQHTVIQLPSANSGPNR